jgi:4-hydroxybenzoyl-CoA thioesterase
MNEIEIEVRFSDCGPAGIAFYGNFFTWFDHGLWRLFDRAGYGRRAIAERWGLLGWPLISTEGRFLVPVREGERLALETRISRWGRSSFDVAHRLRRDGRPVAEGFERRIWAAPRADGEPGLDPRPVPEEVRLALAALVEP